MATDWSKLLRPNPPLTEGGSTLVFVAFFLFIPSGSVLVVNVVTLLTNPSPLAEVFLILGVLLCGLSGLLLKLGLSFREYVPRDEPWR